MRLQCWPLAVATQQLGQEAGGAGQPAGMLPGS